MSQVFNRHSELELRRELRHSMPPAEVLLWKRLQRKQVATAKFRRQPALIPLFSTSTAPKSVWLLNLMTQVTMAKKPLNAMRRAKSSSKVMVIVFLRFLNQDIYRNIEGVVETIEVKVEELRAQNHLRAQVVRDSR